MFWQRSSLIKHRTFEEKADRRVERCPPSSLEGERRDSQGRRLVLAQEIRCRAGCGRDQFIDINGDGGVQASAANAGTTAEAAKNAVIAVDKPACDTLLAGRIFKFRAEAAKPKEAKGRATDE